MSSHFLKNTTFSSSTWNTLGLKSVNTLKVSKSLTLGRVPTLMNHSVKVNDTKSMDLKVKYSVYPLQAASSEVIYINS